MYIQIVYKQYTEETRYQIQLLYVLIINVIGLGQQLEQQQVRGVTREGFTDTN